ncbi:MAG TPA: ABC transporter ATP-binding protein [Actinomycetota bacterium]|nr:ABC transporter ATP-binding protein [Actinomycetota bacterium]
MALLEVRDLHVTFKRRGRPAVAAVDGVSFDVEPGSMTGIVGESGCGKSVTSLAIMGLLPSRGVEASGSVRLDGIELIGLSDEDMRGIRGRRIAMIFQDPMTSLNPVLTIGRQISEAIRRHFGTDDEEARRRAAEILDAVGIPGARKRLGDFPHQFSGGMRQRVVIAMALACEPSLIIADEPTTALDVTIQAQILELIRALVVERGTALIMITHDLGVVANMCETVNVMYAGRFVETAERYALFAEPRHPYTAGLLASVPRLDEPRGTRLNPIRGNPRDVIPWHTGCAFAPRCDNVIDACTAGTPALAEIGFGRTLRCFNPVPAAPEEHA